MYLFCKQHESDGAALMVTEGLRCLALKYFPQEELKPGGTMSDHSSAFRKAFAHSFPESPFGTCWPHIIRKWTEGEYCSKKWTHMQEVAGHLRILHLARSADMRDLLVRQLGAVWDTWGTQMNKFWNSYLIDNWDVWTIGIFEARLCTPSQQEQETWHRQILQSRIPGLFKASTEYVFAESMPQLIEMDALILPNTLQFDVPAIPKGMMAKALWYIENQTTHIHAKRMGDGEVGFYILIKNNSGKFKSITKKLVEMYEKALNGEPDDRLADVEHLCEVCDSMHHVSPASEIWGLCECEGNPGRFVCDCKGYKGYGICSHVLAINHKLKLFNVRHQLVSIGKRAVKTTGGNKLHPEPALQRAPTREPDSSDEEEERLLELGRQGK